MNAADLLDHLRRAGVRLTPVGDALRFRAPAGVMTDDLRRLIRDHKEPLLSHLYQWPPRPSELAPPEEGGWPDSLRERWGRRAAALEDEGLCWRAAERQSFEEIRAEQAPGAVPAPTRAGWPVE
jgi:hypothetical protein